MGDDEDYDISFAVGASSDQSYEGGDDSLDSQDDHDPGEVTLNGVFDVVFVSVDEDEVCVDVEVVGVGLFVVGGDMLQVCLEC